MPVLAGILVAESRRDADPRFLAPGVWPLAFGSLLVLLGLAALATATIYAAAMGWTHSMAEFMLSVALVFVLAASWLGFADQRVRFIPFNWAAAVAVILWIFAGPLPPGTYARLALFLQAEVTDGVVRVLGAFGIAAYRNGNVIELARASVGVSEACSGVRSLVSCTVAGLFLSALLVRRPSHRALVIAISPAIGLAMNFIRSLLLTLLVNSGVRIEGSWHDVTGASILAVTTLLVLAFAFCLRRRENRPAAPRSSVDYPRFIGRSPLLALVGVALVVAAGAGAFVAAETKPSASADGPTPDLAALFPPPAPGWSVRATPDLEQFSAILQTHTLAERVYSLGAEAGSPHLILYLAYWRPGQAPVSLVDAHTPDACWPGVGWEIVPSASARDPLEIDGRSLAPAECRLFSRNQLETHVWFWHLYGGKPLTYVDPYSAPRLLGLGLRYGFGHSEDQLFVRISSDRPWREIASEPTVRQFVGNLKALGL